VTCLHPATFMPTAMVLESGRAPVSTLDAGVRATLRLIDDAAVDGVTGEFFDGVHPGRALDQAYDAEFRTRLAELTGRLLADRSATPTDPAPADAADPAPADAADPAPADTAE
jgi:hypothetical protein